MSQSVSLLKKNKLTELFLDKIPSIVSNRSAQNTLEPVTIRRAIVGFSFLRGMAGGVLCKPKVVNSK